LCYTNGVSAPQSPRRMRPWYFVAAMCLTWVVGVFGATGGCAELSFMRGSQQLPDALEEQTEAQTEPLERLPLVMEKARLAALAEHHRQAFPLSAAQLLLCALLALVSGAAIAGRRGSRVQALQIVAANAALALLAYLLLSPVRDAVAEAVANDIAQFGPGSLAELDDGTGAATTWRSLYHWGEILRLLLLEAVVFGSAALALTRQRTKDFFAAAEQAAEQRRDENPGDD
jgi:hypothetical protein